MQQCSSCIFVISYAVIATVTDFSFTLQYHYYCYCTQQVAARVHAVSEILLPLSVVNTAVRQHYTEFLCAMANDARWMVSHLLLQLLELMNI
jgi:hypothetical protein